ncbi:MAG: hypothetical protein V7605_2140 [Acidimicrobiaceae bacterium]
MTAPTTDEGDARRVPASPSVIVASVRGATHVRDGRPNQDAVGSWQGPGVRPVVVVAVSDGHGSATCFRSEAGARWAVAVALDCGRRLLADTAGHDRASIERRAGVDLPGEIVDRWSQAVTDEIERRPFTDDELAPVESRGRLAVDANPLLAYGATLIVGLASEAYAVFVQVGDGDVLTADAEGDATRPVARDGRLFADETTSLCMPGAAGEFRVGSRPLVGGSPVLALLATDGLANAYPEDGDFLRVGPDLRAQVREHGLATVSERLEGWLQEASVHSGDDVTAALIWFGDAPASTA